MTYSFTLPKNSLKIKKVKPFIFKNHSTHTYTHTHTHTYIYISYND